MRVLGFKDTFGIITEAKIAKVKEKEMIDKAAFKGAGANEDTGDPNILGASMVITSKTKRNPNAKQLRDDWNKIAASTLKDIRSSYIKNEPSSSSEVKSATFPALQEQSPLRKL